MKKKISWLLGTIIMLGLVLLSACGGATAEKSPYEGKWVGVVLEGYGVVEPVEKALGEAMAIEVKNGGKAVLTFGEETGSGKWTVEDNQITFDIDGVEMVGVIEENIFTIDDIFGMGVKVIFAKEGSDEANPEIYMKE